MGITLGKDTKPSRNRRYRIKTRWSDGIADDVIEAEDVDKALNKLAEKLDCSSLELSTLTESIHVYNTIKNEWVAHKPWWVEEKELYYWEK